LIFLIILGKEYTLWSSSLCSFLQPPITSPLFDPNILLNTMFPYTLSLCSSLNVRDNVSHPYRTTGKIIVLYILICTFFTADEKTEGSGLNGSKHYPRSISPELRPESFYHLLLLLPNIWSVPHFHSFC
jgi:hypothetical protein